jgi:hypothetical protein
MDLRKVPDLDQRVIEAVRGRTPQGENFSILGLQLSFLDGRLYTVGFQGPPDDDGRRISYFNRVYVTKRSIEAYGHDEFLIQIVGARHSRSIRDLFANTEVVSGIIAVLVTVAIVPTFIISQFTGADVPVPTWITSGWLLILGFYFGKASGAKD